MEAHFKGPIVQLPKGNGIKREVRAPQSNFEQGQPISSLLRRFKNQSEPEYLPLQSYREIGTENQTIESHKNKDYSLKQYQLDMSQMLSDLNDKSVIPDSKGSSKRNRPKTFGSSRKQGLLLTKKSETSTIATKRLKTPGKFKGDAAI